MFSIFKMNKEKIARKTRALKNAKALAAAYQEAAEDKARRLENLYFQSIQKNSEIIKLKKEINELEARLSAR